MMACHRAENLAMLLAAAGTLHFNPQAGWEASDARPPLTKPRCYVATAFHVGATLSAGCYPINRAICSRMFARLYRREAPPRDIT